MFWRTNARRTVKTDGYPDGRERTTVKQTDGRSRRTDGHDGVLVKQTNGRTDGQDGRRNERTIRTDRRSKQTDDRNGGQTGWTGQTGQMDGSNGRTDKYRLVEKMSCRYYVLGKFWEYDGLPKGIDCLNIQLFITAAVFILSIGRTCIKVADELIWLQNNTDNLTGQQDFTCWQYFKTGPTRFVEVIYNTALRLRRHKIASQARFNALTAKSKYAIIAAIPQLEYSSWSLLAGAANTPTDAARSPTPALTSSADANRGGSCLSLSIRQIASLRGWKPDRGIQIRLTIVG